MLTPVRSAGRLVARLTAVAVLVAGGALVASTPGSAADGPCVSGCGGSSSGSAGGGTIKVTVSGTGVRGGGGSVDVDTTTIAVHPVCWYFEFMTGKAYAEMLADPDRARIEHGLGGFDEIPGWEKHADDDKGHWYGGMCSSEYWPGDTLDGWAEATTAWFADHDTVWVDAGDAPPDPLVTPEMLAEIASSELSIEPGTVAWNPTRRGDAATFVGVDTWVWVEGAPHTLDVTASVYGGAVWARVTATLGGMDVSAEGGTSRHCADGGTPWSSGASTDCSVVFQRSSANQPGLRSTLTAREVWHASWVSSANAAPTALADQTVTTTSEVPVAEIQSLVTSGS
ncbi:hypothetical protein [Cellulomonas edaphi]|uniref:Uncharacterized protein n=1 Tax=Cellulomonas edaphi TaxID=3053468 RepID=A0ABT7S6J6_9CELL|nr:hypothetical protein [Cellulomons edaphi]MDM7831242.1 hypothetical protein [Cellulomons edaphi]